MARRIDKKPRRPTRIWTWEGHLEDPYMRRRVGLVVYMASTMNMEPPGRWAMRVTLQIGHILMERLMADLIRDGVINEANRVLPGWREKVLV